MTVQSPAIVPVSSPPVSPVTQQAQLQQPTTTSPQLVAMRARINSEWRDLVYREALRMAGALRQILAQSNNSSRNQLVKEEEGIISVFYFLNVPFFRLKSSWDSLIIYWEN